MKQGQPKSVPAIQLLDKGVLRLDSDHGKLAVSYRLTRSRRARYIRLTINRNNEVVLTLPAGCSFDRGLRFMRTKTEWLTRHLREMAPPETLYGFLRKRGFLAVKGSEVGIDWRTPAEGPWLHYRPENERVVLAFDPLRDDEGQLKSLVRQLAAETLSERAHALAALHGLPLNKVSVRDQISRWGSCSARKNVSLNWRLLLLPPEVKDYVIWHELAHLVQMNHSNRFWGLLERLDPKAYHHDNVLSQVTNRIMAIGRTTES
jgi:predicted metal-dependent hydrolase